MPIEFPDVAAKDNLDSKDFVTIKDGQSVQGILKGKAVVLYKHGFGQTSVLCTGKATCEQCSSGDKKKFRSRFNLVITENGTMISKILEQGWKVFEDIRALQKEGGYDLEKTVIKISRKGATLNDTTYSVIPLPVTLNDATLKKLAEVKTHDLSPQKVEPQKPAETIPEDNTFFTNDDIPF